MLSLNAVFSQTVPDSLSKKLNAATNDSVKARTLLDIGENIESTSTEKSLVYYQQAFGLAEKIHNKRLIFSSLVNLGIGNMESNHLDTAVAYFKMAMPVAVAIRDTNRIAVVYSNLGNAYRYKERQNTGAGKFSAGGGSAGEEKRFGSPSGRLSEYQYFSH